MKLHLKILFFFVTTLLLQTRLSAVPMTCETNCDDKCRTPLGIEYTCRVACESWRAANCAVDGHAAWGEAGSTLYPAQSSAQYLRNPSHRSMRDFEIRFLRQWFNVDMLNKVRMHYDADLPPEIGVGNFVIAVKAAAQTFGYDVYIQGTELSATNFEDRQAHINRLALLTHEMIHVQQFWNRGEDLSRFGRDYFAGYAQGGGSYENNPLEREAKTFEADHLTLIAAEINRLADATATPAAPGTLVEFDTGCQHPNGRSNQCASAIHRYAVKYDVGSAGISQEVGPNSFLVAFVPRSETFGIEVSELQGTHPGCDFPNAYSNACVAAIQRACERRDYSAGFSQELGASSFGVACFHANWYGEISLSELQATGSECSFPQGQSNGCSAAIRRACVAKGYSGGIAQQVGSNGFGVACFLGNVLKINVN